MKTNNKWYNSSFASCVGWGIMFFFVSLGIGGCILLEAHAIKERSSQTQNQKS